MWRLPIYVLIDTSVSMTGETIEAARNGLQVIQSVAKKSANDAEHPYIGVIEFNKDARQICPLTDIEKFCPPELSVVSTEESNLGMALECVTKKIKKREKEFTNPLVFIMTNGNVTNVSSNAVKNFLSYKRESKVIAFISDQDANTDRLKKIADEIVNFGTLNSAHVAGWLEIGFRSELSRPPDKIVLPSFESDRAGELLKKEINGIKTAFRYCPTGTFLFHGVNIQLTGFYIQETPVTQELWQTVMGNNPSFFKGTNNPVDSVSWFDCQEFVTKCNGLAATITDVREMCFSLPTEAQWEYACRAGSDEDYCYGDGVEQLKNYAWFTENSKDTTHPVGKKKPNKWNIYDMHGNVWEWCRDVYGRLQWQDGLTDPYNTSSYSKERVNRGGCCGSHSEKCRCSHRDRNKPNERYKKLGIRLVLSLMKATPE
ncbi:MAG: SUMF1/EgtB/PvdO family nonheme iron enzyme [Planctomycetaceae bacterium]|jgi:uncharacterized protein YegL|nr:SUMF1/EgtB/PvdO family nonheme iron enzyme [Planctomycetaceae bacterium]